MEEAQKYFDIWNRLPNYTRQEDALSSIFRGKKSPYKKNDDPTSVTIKVSLLDDFYSTNIYRGFDMVDNILAITDFDKRLKDGDLSLVNNFMTIEYNHPVKGLLKKRCYSFATKYCSHHQPDKFPIFDSFVEKVLWDLQKQKPSIFNEPFKRDDLHDYEKYSNILNLLRDICGLQNLSYKELDRYLWQLGKRYFSPYIDSVNGKIDYNNV